MPVYRSRTTTHGRNMAGARALWRATGMKDDDFSKPIIAIANSFTQFVPGHVHLKYLGQLVAREIEAAAPDLIGLQEAELILVQSPGDLLSGSSTPATEIVYDYLEILLDELDRLGLCYEPAAIGVQTDIELPAATSTGYDDIRLVDRDVILARCGVQTSRPRARHFKVNLVVPVGGLGSPVAWVPIVRGWQEVDARIGLRTFRFVNTHLEPAVLPQVGAIQLAQAKQLLIELADERLPVVLVGDFNSAADGSTTKTYALLTHSGFMDAWRSPARTTPATPAARLRIYKTPNRCSAGGSTSSSCATGTTSGSTGSRVGSRPRWSATRGWPATSSGRPITQAQ
mgnify:CR=1 FL=1